MNLKRTLNLVICMMLLSAAIPRRADAEAAKALPAVADASQMTAVEEVVEDWMVPIPADSLKDGTYPVDVDCSSSMFRIREATLQVEKGEMTAVLTMEGKGYLRVYPGSAEEAAAAEESSCIPFAENEEEAHCYTIPVKALDAPVLCAAFSKNKELWYDRTLVFRADSLPAEAFADGFLTTAESLGLQDGTYTVKVSLSGGSGKAKLESPAQLSVSAGKCEARIVWGSRNYDYMIVNQEKLLPEAGEGNASFQIPVAFFDRPMTVVADTVAMSQPHEITYRLTFDSKTLTPTREDEAGR